MARKSKYQEPTDVVSVRLPVSFIEKLDRLCHNLRLGRAEFIIQLLQRYPLLPPPGKARVWVANLLIGSLGAGVGILAAAQLGQSGSALPSPYATGPLQLETMAPHPQQDAPEIVPVSPVPSETVPLPMPLRNLLDSDRYRWGNLQYAIPRLVSDAIDGASGVETEGRP